MSDSNQQECHNCRVLIVDDHPIVQHGLLQLLTAQPDMEVCGQAASEGEALEQIEAADPQVVIVDITLTDGNGLHLIQKITKQFPQVKTLVSSIHDEKSYAPRAIQAGAVGYIEKRESISKIVEAIRCILAGEIYLSPPMARQLLHRAATDEPLSQEPGTVLSNRELEVFELLGQGRTVQQIAGRLKISPKTVESHRKKIKEKLNLKNSAQLNLLAFQWAHDHN